MPKFEHWENTGDGKWNNENTDVRIEVRNVYRNQEEDAEEPWEVLKFYDRRGMDMGQTVDSNSSESGAKEDARDYMRNFPFAGEKQHLMDEAYDMGYEEAEGVASDSPEDDARKIHSQMQDSFTQSAQWANNILPELRKLSGCDDGGAGTYQDCSEVSREMVDVLVDQYWEGALSKIEEET